MPRAFVSHSRIDRGDLCEIELEEFVMQELFGRILNMGLLLGLCSCSSGPGLHHPDREPCKSVLPASPHSLDMSYHHPECPPANSILHIHRFKIKDDEIGRDSLAAWACIRLDRLREGYRLVHLLDSTGKKAGGILLVRITKKTS